MRTEKLNGETTNETYTLRVNQPNLVGDDDDSFNTETDKVMQEAATVKKLVEITYIGKFSLRILNLSNH